MEEDGPCADCRLQRAENAEVQRGNQGDPIDSLRACARSCGAEAVRRSISRGLTPSGLTLGLDARWLTLSLSAASPAVSGPARAYRWSVSYRSRSGGGGGGVGAGGVNRPVFHRLPDHHHHHRHKRDQITRVTCSPLQTIVLRTSHGDSDCSGGAPVTCPSPAVGGLARRHCPGD